MSLISSNRLFDWFKLLVLCVIIVLDRCLKRISNHQTILHGKSNGKVVYSYVLFSKLFMFLLRFLVSVGLLAKLKWPFMKWWIYNGTLKTLNWLEMWKIQSFFLIRKCYRIIKGLTRHSLWLQCYKPGLELLSPEFRVSFGFLKNYYYNYYKNVF